MLITVADIINIMETIAPNYLAEEWDNAGLQIGQKKCPVRTIRVALDPTPDVISAACREKIDLLITHHPFLFRPLKSIDFKTPASSLIQKAIQNNLCIFSAHTNLDNAADGINDVLANRIGLQNLRVLGETKAPENYKLVVYTPIAYEQQILNALFETNAGNIGKYSCCSFRHSGKGTFLPDTSAKPFSGKAGEISHTDEIRIEAVVLKEDIKKVVAHLRNYHPYETMTYDVYPLKPNPELSPVQGPGRVGELDKEMELTDFASYVKDKLSLNMVRVAGKPNLLVKTAALCSGSGSGMMANFFASGAQVYISGDLNYHSARDAEAEGLGLIDMGHFASEHLMVEVLADRIQRRLDEIGAEAVVKAYVFEKEPFIII